MLLAAHARERFGEEAERSEALAVEEAGRDQLGAEDDHDVRVVVAQRRHEVVRIAPLAKLDIGRADAVALLIERGRAEIGRLADKCDAQRAAGGGRGIRAGLVEAERETGPARDRAARHAASIMAAVTLGSCLTGRNASRAAPNPRSGSSTGCAMRLLPRSCIRRRSGATSAAA